MTDTHTHLYDEAFAADGADGCVMAVQRAMQAGIDRFVMPNVDMASVEPMTLLASRFPGRVFTAIGLHPTELDSGWRDTLAEIMARMPEKGCVAIGEVGIDLYWDKSFRQEQMDCFAGQLRIAEEKRLPVIIHCREALDETLDVIKAHQGKLPKLVFHSFTGSPEDVKRIREVADAWFGINGVVTFKNAGSLREAVREIGLDRILLETDSPYLAPVPKRGRRNESAFLPYICDKVAELLSVAPDVVAQATDRNAEAVFDFDCKIQ